MQGKIIYEIENWYYIISESLTLNATPGPLQRHPSNRWRWSMVPTREMSVAELIKEIFIACHFKVKSTIPKARSRSVLIDNSIAVYNDYFYFDEIRQRFHQT